MTKDKEKEGDKKACLNVEANRKKRILVSCRMQPPKASSIRCQSVRMQEKMELSQKAVNDIAVQMIGKTLIDYPWYHGLMPRKECEQLLKKNGDFLVRRTKRNKSSVYCVSVFASDEVKHFPLHYDKGEWRLNSFTAGTLDELICFLIEQAKPLDSTKHVLKNGIARPDYYILHEYITIDKKIGGGAFGEVFTGFLNVQDYEVPVAIKQIKGKVSKKQIEQFIKEAKIMRRFSHPNIVRFLGIASQEEPIMIVMELAVGGNLKDFFRTYDSTDEQQLGFVRDACRGMCYLSQCQVIHRDLAARNCLLGAQNELKISDFGLSVADKDELKMTSLNSVPIKWLAPETLLAGVFSSKSDVWSFGVLIWEIFTKCQSDPFPGESNVEAKAKIISMSPPMEAPHGSTEIIKTIMKSCFIRNPKERPGFVQILKMLAPNEKAPEKLMLE